MANRTLNRIGVFGVALAAGVAGLGVMTAATATTAERTVAAIAEAEAPDLVLVKWHADWCGKCRALAPTWESAGEALGSEGVLFVNLDKTNKQTTKQAEHLTAQIGLAPIWDRYGKKTGVLTLHDAETGELVREFTVGATVDDIRSAVNEAG
ncbi:MAG: thioredoxin domain-containing protein [Planctomycetota bacterium]